MEKIDYLIVTENATLGQKMYTNQRKEMLEDLGYAAKIVCFTSPSIKITLDFLRIAYIYKKNLEKYLNRVKPEIVEFYCPSTLILQNKKLIKNFKTIASFDLPFGVNIWHFGSSLLHYLENKKFHEVDLIISLTKYGKHFLINKYGIEEKKIVHIPYALDARKIKSYKVSDEGFALSYCSKDRLERKGLDILIKAWSLLPKNKKLVITGLDKIDATHYLNKKNIKVPNNVKLIGLLTREKYLNTLTKSSFFVSASRFEEFGQIIIEALSLRKPVVSTPTIGPSEFLQEIDKKLISPSFSPIDLANTIKYLEEHLEDRKLQQHLWNAANNYNYSKVRNSLKKEVIDALLKKYDTQKI